MKRAALSVVDLVFTPGVRRVLAVAASIVLLLLISGRRPSADMASCDTTFGVGSFQGGVCQVSGSHTLSGVVTVNETLHMLAGSSIVVADPSLTLNIAGGFIMEADSIVDGGDRNCSGDPAFPITITAGGDVDVKTGAIVRSNGCSGGAIAITGKIMDIDGLVQSKGFESGTGAVQRPGGGPITLRSDCLLTISDTGHVISEGSDPGADLVHLEACEVVVHGLVESTATNGDAGHALPNNPANHCNLDPGAHPLFSGNPGASGYTACVEIWSNKVTIDDTDGQNGEVAADGIRSDSGGPRRSWIDVLSKGDITIVANTTGHYAVHANPPGKTNQYGGLITLKSKSGAIVTTALVPGTKGLAIQSNASGGGGTGGDIVVQAGGAAGSGNVDFKGDSVQANGNGATGEGGTIKGQSFHDNVFGALPGELLANAAGGPSGAITLRACLAATYTGTSNPAATQSSGVDCGLDPAFSAVAHWLTGESIIAFFTSHANCETLCSNLATKSGMKFDDADNSGSLTAGDTPIQGWPISLLTTANVVLATTSTAADGTYSFTVTPGTYRVCEGAGVGNLTQTFPNGGTVHPGETIINTCPAPNTRGYEFTVVSGDALKDNDFGNHKNEDIPPPSCPEDPNRAGLLTRTVRATAFAGVPNYLTLQAAYNAAKVSPSNVNEVIGMFLKLGEDVVLDGYTAKSMTITQCTSASERSWTLTANKKLLIIGPDSTGSNASGAGWDLATGGHELKSIRSNGASAFGVRIQSGANSNAISFNNVASSGIGIEVLSNSNTLKAGTIGPNAGSGVHIGAGKTGNNVSGMTIQKNGNGVLVEGNSNTISSNKLNSNSLNGIKVTGGTSAAPNTIQSNQSDSNTGDGYNVAGSGNIVKDNKANTNTGDGLDLSGTGQKVTGSASSGNTGADYRISALPAVSAPSGNKADGSSIPSASKCTGFFTNAAVLSCS